MCQSCSLRSIFSRDSGLCWICTQPVDWDSTHPALRPSRDHIIPQKDGGRTSPDNLKLAHQGCNSARHALPRTSTKKRKEGRVGVSIHYGWILRDGEIRQFGKGSDLVFFRGEMVVFQDGRPYPITNEICCGNDDQLVERLLDACAA